MFRTFVAIAVPEEVRTELLAAQHDLQTVLPRQAAAWSKPDNMHLTLRFLGNVAATRVLELTNKLRPALTGFGALELICERLGCFPDLRFPRVVWAWVHDEAERLPQLQLRIEAVVREFAEQPAESRFVGHITLARPKQIKRPEAERLARFVEGAVGRTFGRWRAKEVLLLRSELSPGGSKYVELAGFPLG
jgi:RNA 2',3'-cyclic 3'-phosphodiesterase